MSYQKPGQCIFQSRMPRSKMCTILTWTLAIAIILISAINTEARYNNVCAKRITLYEDRNCTGAAIDLLPYRVDGSNLCYDLPSNWYDRASSMDTHNNCVTVWNRAGCSGKWQRIISSSRYVNNLVDLFNFDKEIRSVRQCS